MRTLALRTAIILTIGLAVVALWQMREAAGLLGVALALAAGLEPLSRRIAARGLPHATAAAIVFIGAVLSIAAALAGLGVLAAADLARLAESLPLWYGSLRRAMIFSGGLIGQLGLALPYDALSADQLGDPQVAGEALLSVMSWAVLAAALVISVASLGFYWLADQQRIERLWLSLLPLGARTRARAIWREVYHEIGVYVRGEAAIIAVTTATLLIIFSALRVPGASLLAVAGGLAQVMPILGPPLAVLPGSLAALAQSPTSGAMALAGSLIALICIRALLAPRLFRAGTSPNPALVIVFILVLFQAGGLLLVWLAPPLAAATQAVTRILSEDRRANMRRLQPEQLYNFEQRLDTIAAAIPADHPDARRLQDLVDRARRLVEQSAPLAEAEVGP